MEFISKLKYILLLNLAVNNRGIINISNLVNTCKYRMRLVFGGLVYFTKYKFRLCITTSYKPVNEQERTQYYASEMHGSPLIELIAFRCTNQMAVWLKSRGLVEGRDYSAVIRRLLTKAMKEEGFDPNGII